MVEESLQIWRRIAAWWDQAIGEGNDFQRQLIMPVTDRLLAIRPGEWVLDACCGNGNYSRRLSRTGANVVAFDGAESFINVAKKRTTPDDGHVEYFLIDATDESAMKLLGENRFDAAVCSMAVMDLSKIAPLLNAVQFLLKPTGRFVFSISHPCFNSNQSVMTAELINTDGKLEQIFGVKISQYLQNSTDLASGILHQPEPHYTFHRSISALLNECFAAGFILDGLEEPAYPSGAGQKNPFSWMKRPDIPPAMVFRIRPNRAGSCNAPNEF
jgi:2-polyprenyl-3-methyl-5-hydroxy-6-metoxy-1,4-benzoquinol methylase